MPPVDLSSKTITRLQKHAIPLVDTFDTVIAKLRCLRQGQTQAGPIIPIPVIQRSRSMIRRRPPNLAHTTVKLIKFCGTLFKPADTYWNTLMHAAIRKVGERHMSPEALKGLHIGQLCHWRERRGRIGQISSGSRPFGAGAGRQWGMEDDLSSWRSPPSIFPWKSPFDGRIIRRPAAPNIRFIHGPGRMDPHITVPQDSHG